MKQFEQLQTYRLLTFLCLLTDSMTLQNNPNYSRPINMPTWDVTLWIWVEDEAGKFEEKQSTKKPTDYKKRVQKATRLDEQDLELYEQVWPKDKGNEARRRQSWNNTTRIITIDNFHGQKHLNNSIEISDQQNGLSLMFSVKRFFRLLQNSDKIIIKGQNTSIIYTIVKTGQCRPSIQNWFDIAPKLFLR